jgi:hypothetical protein
MTKGVDEVSQEIHAHMSTHVLEQCCHDRRSS